MTSSSELRDEFNDVIVGEFLRRVFGQVPDMTEVAQYGSFVLHEDGTEWFSWAEKFQCRVCSLREWEAERATA